MAVSVTLYNFAKVRNSTKQPVSGIGTYSCLLKDGTDVWNPTFILTGDPHTCNYCSAFGKYYYVDRIDYLPPHWHLTCTLDSMATWKTQIGAASLYVTRANNTTLWDKSLIDQLPAKVGPISSAVPLKNVFNYPETGTYVVTIAGSTSSNGCTHWGFDPSSYQMFIRTFLDVTSWSFPALMRDEMKDQVKPLDYIKDVRWYPILPIFVAAPEEIYIGTWNTQCSGIALPDGYIWPNDKDLSIPSHPQSGTLGVMLNSSTFTQRTWCDPWFGMFSLDPNVLSKYSTLNYHIDVDMSCGFGHMRLTATSPNLDPMILADREGEIGVSVLFSVQSHGALSAAAQGVSAGIQLGTGNIGGFLSSMANIFSACYAPKMQTTGSIGSRAMYAYDPVLYSEFMEVLPLDPVTQGYPVCKTLTLGSLSGFVQVAKGDVAVPGPSWAAAEIKSYLEGGFYYE